LAVKHAEQLVKATIEGFGDNVGGIVTLFENLSGMQEDLLIYRIFVLESRRMGDT